MAILAVWLTAAVALILLWIDNRADLKTAEELQRELGAILAEFDVDKMERQLEAGQPKDGGLSH